MYKRLWLLSPCLITLLQVLKTMSRNTRKIQIDILNELKAVQSLEYYHGKLCVETKFKKSVVGRFVQTACVAHSSYRKDFGTMKHGLHYMCLQPTTM
jgi:hypothetical protein